MYTYTRHSYVYKNDQKVDFAYMGSVICENTFDLNSLYEIRYYRLHKG